MRLIIFPLVKFFYRQATLPYETLPRHGVLACKPLLNRLLNNGRTVGKRIGFD